MHDLSAGLGQRVRRVSTDPFGAACDNDNFSLHGSLPDTEFTLSDPNPALHHSNTPISPPHWSGGVLEYWVGQFSLLRGLFRFEADFLMAAVAERFVLRRAAAAQIKRIDALSQHIPCPCGPRS